MTSHNVATVPLKATTIYSTVESLLHNLAVMSKLIKNHWACLIIFTAAIYQCAAGL